MTSTQHLYTGRGQLTASACDIDGYVYLAFQDSPGTCWIYKINPSDPENPVDSVEVAVTKITKIRQSDESIFFTCEDSIYIGGWWNSGNVELISKPTDGVSEISIGRSNLSGNTNNTDDQVSYQKYTCTQTGTIDRLHIYSFGSGNIKVAIYSDNSGTPGTLLASVTQAITSSIDDITIPEIEVTSGTVYWLAMVTSTVCVLKNGYDGRDRLIKNISYESYDFPETYDGTGFSSDNTAESYISAWTVTPPLMELEAPVDVASKSDVIYFLIPGNESGTNAKVLIYLDWFYSGAPALFIDLSESGKVINNASCMVLSDFNAVEYLMETDTKLHIFTNSSPSLRATVTIPYENYTNYPTLFPNSVSYTYTVDTLSCSGVDTDYCFDAVKYYNNIYVITKNIPSSLIIFDESIDTYPYTAEVLTKDGTDYNNAQSIDVTPFFDYNSYSYSENGKLAIACENGKVLQLTLSHTPNCDLLLHFNNNLTDETGKTVTGINSPTFLLDNDYHSIYDKETLELTSVSSQYLEVNDSSSFDIGSGDFSIDFLFDPKSTTRMTLLSFEGDFRLAIEYHYQGTRNINIWASSNGSSWDLINAEPAGNGIGTISLVDSRPNHVQITRNGNNWTTYINGRKDIDITVSGSVFYRNEKMRIGAGPSGKELYTNGYIDEFKFTKGIARVTSEYNIPNTKYLGQSSISNIEVINTTSSNDLNSIISISNYLIFTSTDSLNGEAYIIDDYTRKYINTDLRCYQTEIIETDLRLGYASLIDTDLRVFSWQDNRYNILNTDIRLGYAKLLNTDLRCKYKAIELLNTDLRYVKSEERATVANTFSAESGQTSFIATSPIIEIASITVGANPVTNYTVNSTNNTVTITDPISEGDSVIVTYKTIAETPKSQEDFSITIGGASCTDVDLGSININIQVDDIPYVTFTLARKHDNLDYTLAGVYQQITNKNEVIVYFDNRQLLNAKITKIEAISGEDKVNITAEATYNQQFFRERISTTMPSVKTTYSNVNKFIPVGASIFAPTSLGSLSSFNTIEKMITQPVKTTTSFSITWAGTYTNTLPVQELGKRLSIYDVLLVDVAIDKPLSAVEQWTATQIGTDYYKNKIKDNNSFFGMYSDMGTIIKEDIERGEVTLSSRSALDSYAFDPSYEYFFVISGYKYNGTATTIDGINYPSGSKVYFYNLYVGTDVAAINSEFAVLTSIKIYYQKIKDNIEEAIGFRKKEFGLVAGASYSIVASETENLLWTGGNKTLQKDYSNFVLPNTGKYIPKTRLVDKDGVLYQVTSEAYDYINYSKRYFDVEYNRQRSNFWNQDNSESITGPDGETVTGTNLGQTTAQLELTVDSLFYYGIYLLNKVNLVNTDYANIYNKRNGFPLYIKGINIDSSKMTVTLTCDNDTSVLDLKKNPDLLINNGEEPLENSSEDNPFPTAPAVIPEISIPLYNRYDFKTLKKL